MKTELTILPPDAEHQIAETDYEPAIDRGILIKIFLAALTGLISYVGALFTTVVEEGGFWRYFSLGVCVAAFICAICFVVTACRDFGKNTCFSTSAD